MTNARPTHNQTLPRDGFSRFRDIQPFICMSRSKWLLLVAAQKAPQPIHLGPRTVVYANSELHRFFADPANYSVNNLTSTHE